MFACFLFLVYNIRNNLQRGCKKMKEMKDVRRIVVKVGSSTLTHPQGGLHFQKIDQLAMVLSDIKNSGKDVILVSSGAVSAGSVSYTHLDVYKRQTKSYTAYCAI